MSGPYRDITGPTSVVCARADGRVISASYLFGVKAPQDSKCLATFKVLATTPADKAFRPLAEGHCAMIRT